MKYLLWGAVFGFVLACLPPAALAADCSGLLKELENMRRAQRSLLTSLADNHETFALALEETSTQFSSYSNRVPERALQSMNKTAQSFRERGVKAKRQADKLDAATADLIARVRECLAR